MKIGVISLVSDVHDPSAVAGNSNTILSLLKKSFEIEEINISEIHRVDIPIVFIVTGGTEHKFKKIFPGLLHIKENEHRGHWKTFGLVDIQ